LAQDETGQGLRKIWFDMCLLGCAVLISALQFGLFPILFEPGWIGAGVLVLVATFTEPLHYGLMHESIHGNLLPGESRNRGAGRALGIALGLPWETMRFGHLAHHGFNRHDFDRPEALAPNRSRVISAIAYYFNLVIGNAIAYAIAPFLTVVPVSAMRWVLENVDRNPETAPLRMAALRAFSTPAKRHAVQFDLAAIVALDALALWLWGAWWPVFVASMPATHALPDGRRGSCSTRIFMACIIIIHSFLGTNCRASSSTPMNAMKAAGSAHCCDSSAGRCS
jgi:fatty acid desaturase